MEYRVKNLDGTSKVYQSLQDVIDENPWAEQVNEDYKLYFLVIKEYPILKDVLENLDILKQACDKFPQLRDKLKNLWSK